MEPRQHAQAPSIQAQPLCASVRAQVQLPSCPCSSRSLPLPPHSQVTSVVPVGEPIFQPIPHEVTFRGYEPYKTYEATLRLRNNDAVRGWGMRARACHRHNARTHGSWGYTALITVSLSVARCTREGLSCTGPSAALQHAALGDKALSALLLGLDPHDPPRATGAAPRQGHCARLPILQRDARGRRRPEGCGQQGCCRHGGGRRGEGRGCCWEGFAH